VSDIRGRLLALLLRLGVLIIVLVAILAGMRRFTEAEHARAAFELRSRLWLQKVEACRSLAETAGHLVADADEPAFPEAVRAFQAASWGPMVLVADQPLEKALLDFNLSIAEFQNKRIEAPELKQRAHILISTCRCSVERNTWKPGDAAPVSLPEACRGVPDPAG
jgi:hypothetical protein